MTLDELEIEFRKLNGIEFTDNPIIYLCFNDKKTSYEVYAAIGDYFDGQKIMLSFLMQSDKVRVSITSLSTLDTINSNFIEFNKGSYNRFFIQFDSDSVIQFFSGYTTDDFPICKPNIVQQQKYSLFSIGFNILKG